MGADKLGVAVEHFLMLPLLILLFGAALILLIVTVTRKEPRP